MWCEAPEREFMRINKRLSELGVCSRREADKLIEQDRITVNGEPIALGQQVSETDTIEIDGIPATPHDPETGMAETPRPVLLAYYKPRGIVCTTADNDRAENIIEAINYPIRIYPIGRLDKDSEGLILLTNQGELVNRISRARNYHEKEYIVHVDKAVNRDFLTRLADGVYLQELDVTTRPCEVWQDLTLPLAARTHEFHIVITEGKNRQIRRMCAELGYEVTRLRRIRIMGVTAEGLHPGEYREISEEELMLPEEQDSEQDMTAENAAEKEQMMDVEMTGNDEMMEQDKMKQDNMEQDNMEQDDRMEFAAADTAEDEMNSADEMDSEDEAEDGFDADEEADEYDPEDEETEEERAARARREARPHTGTWHAEGENSTRRERPAGSGYGRRDRDSRRSYGDRPSYGRRDRDDRKPYGDKPSFGHRDSSDRDEHRSYGDRPSYGRRDRDDRKPYGDKPSFGHRDSNDRKPYGDKPSYGHRDRDDRKPYGDKPSYGRRDRDDRKPYGDKPSYGHRDHDDHKSFGRRSEGGYRGGSNGRSGGYRGSAQRRG